MLTAHPAVFFFLFKAPEAPWSPTSPSAWRAQQGQHPAATTTPQRRSAAPRRGTCLCGFPKRPGVDDYGQGGGAARPTRARQLQHDEQKLRHHRLPPAPAASRCRRHGRAPPHGRRRDAAEEGAEAVHAPSARPRRGEAVAGWWRFSEMAGHGIGPSGECLRQGRAAGVIQTGPRLAQRRPGCGAVGWWARETEIKRVPQPTSE